jgi:hypothetical protein
LLALNAKLFSVEFLLYCDEAYFQCSSHIGFWFSYLTGKQIRSARHGTSRFGSADSRVFEPGKGREI